MSKQEHSFPVCPLSALIEAIGAVDHSACLALILFVWLSSPHLLPLCGEVHSVTLAFHRWEIKGTGEYSHFLKTEIGPSMRRELTGHLYLEPGALTSGLALQDDREVSKLLWNSHVESDSGLSRGPWEIHEHAQSGKPST